jgi:hypothetical protein
MTLVRRVRAIGEAATAAWRTSSSRTTAGERFPSARRLKITGEVGSGVGVLREVLIEAAEDLGVVD